ncbi:GNAT family N-acetyltransferase [Streptomyces sp. AK08-02]|uniref:GNAT family N-acetyltransferase n=1 Tax=Streptomyces sp. AK08-02 TaxID=3028654 RepID=UPI0029BCF0DB|nr:GNAT family N-acetyltransferase [Streptomyces sp. AK08-02]MDX3747278.1 GNAT family N-acetyltransferase [Streptomyces sp. AK08-02]
METVIVRPFQKDDLASTASALIDVHTTDGYPVEGVDDPEAWLRSADVIAAWVGEGGGEIVGHVAIMRPSGEDAVSAWMHQSDDSVDQIAVLARLFVVKAARKHAVGERLMQAAMDYGSEHGLRLVLDVMAKDAAAMRLYERLGWREIGRAPHHYGSGQKIDAVLYVAPRG